MIVGMVPKIQASPPLGEVTVIEGEDDAEVMPKLLLLESVIEVLVVLVTRTR